MDNTKEQLAQQLYDRASQELDAYLANLKIQPPEQIIDRAYQIVMMSDLLMIFEGKDFSLPELQELVAVKKPLGTLYDEWLRKEDSHMEELRTTVEDFAGGRLRDKATLLYSNPAEPRYDKCFSEAQDADETHLYRASRKRDLDCRRFFEGGISAANESRTMRTFVQEWVATYGHERCKFVLGYTVQHADWDARYSPAAKRDAQSYQYDEGKDSFSEYHTNAHPCLANGAYELLMEQARGKQKSTPQKDAPER